MQASHVVNKVASSEKKQKAKAEAAATAAKGHVLEIDGDNKGVAHLAGCDQDVSFHADISAGAEAPWVVLVHDEVVPESLKAAKKKTKKKNKDARQLVSSGRFSYQCCTRAVGRRVSLDCT